MIYLLSILAFLSGILCIRAKYKILNTQFLIFKPLTLIIIISIIFICPTTNQKYQQLILLGLLFSLVGDGFLIFPKKHFKKGLIAFLIGHICYIGAFALSTGIYYTVWIYLPIIVIGIIYLKNIIPYSGKATIPIIIYVIIIAIMGWMALEGLKSHRAIGVLFAAIGAVLFMISDSVLAMNKFRKKFRSAELIILSTYFTAQWLLALSVTI